MKVWIDAQLSPALATWLNENFTVTAKAVRDLGLRDAKDKEIFECARQANSIVLTKDIDFVHLLSLYGAPPKILWLTCGNTSNSNVKQILKTTFETALELFDEGESLVQITGLQKQL